MIGLAQKAFSMRDMLLEKALQNKWLCLAAKTV